MNARVALFLVGVALAILPEAAAGANSVTIHAGMDPDGSLYFLPRTVRAFKGDDMTLTLVNDDATQPHDWALLSYGGRDIEAYTAASATKTIQFKASELGTYRIVCQVVGHKQRGMEGSFVVDAKGLLPAPDALVVATALVVGAAAFSQAGRSRAK